MNWIPMSRDPAMVEIVRTSQGAGATSCRAKYSFGGRIRVYVDLYGMKRAQLEEKLRWALPKYLEPMVLEDRGDEQ